MILGQKALRIEYSTFLTGGKKKSQFWPALFACNLPIIPPASFWFFDLFVPVGGLAPYCSQEQGKYKAGLEATFFSQLWQV